MGVLVPSVADTSTLLLGIAKFTRSKVLKNSVRNSILAASFTGTNFGAEKIDVAWIGSAQDIAAGIAEWRGVGAGWREGGRVEVVRERLGRTAERSRLVGQKVGADVQRGAPRRRERLEANRPG